MVWQFFTVLGLHQDREYYRYREERHLLKHAPHHEEHIEWSHVDVEENVQVQKGVVRYFKDWQGKQAGKGHLNHEWRRHFAEYLVLEQWENRCRNQDKEAEDNMQKR